MGIAFGQSAGTGPATVSIGDVLTSLERGTQTTQPVRFTGVLSSEPVANSFGETFAFIQDAAGGVSIVTTNGRLSTGQYRRGDVLSVTGTPRRNLGTDQVVIIDARRVGEAAPPVAERIRVVDALSGRYKGRLVTIEGDILPVDASRVIRVRDRSGTITVAGPVEVPLSRDLLARCAEGGRASVTGVIAERGDRAGSEPVVRIYLRDPTDLQFASQPPYRAILLSILGSGVLWTLGYLVVRARQAERRAADVFRAVFDQTFQFVGLMKTDGTLIEANRTALEFAGVSAKDVLGKPLWETPWFSHSEELKAQIREATRAATAGELVRLEVTHPDAQGVLHNVDFSLKPFRNDHGKVTLLIPEGRDITERKQAEVERQKLETQLIQSQKMESVGRLAGGIAHDFNNLLTVINGYSSMALMDLADSNPLRARLNRILEAGERAATLTQALLAYSRQQILQPRVFELNSVMVKMREVLAHVMGDDVEVRLELSKGTIPVFADPHQLEQAIINLATNARDAMPNGGRFSIETAVKECDRNETDAEAGRYAVITVSDTGAGMDEVTLQRIFEPFFSTKETGKGTGLGLAMVHGMVTQSNGDIDVWSEPGKGTRFRIYLPLAEALPEEPENAAPVLAEGGTETILMVEDRTEVRDYITSTLQNYGYRVLAATDASDALDIFQREAEAVQLVLTDVVLPGLSGVDLAARLAQIKPGVKTLFMSGYSDEIVARRGGLDRAHFVRKPFTPEELAHKVRTVLG